MHGITDANLNARDEFLEALARGTPGRQPADAAGPRARGRRAGPRPGRPLVTIDAARLDIAVPGFRGNPARPWLTVAWRARASAPCGVHLGLAEPDGAVLRACVADELGVARRALELDRGAIDRLLLRGERVTFALDHGLGSHALAAWAVARGHDASFRARGPGAKGTLERALVGLGRALVRLVSDVAAPVGRLTLDGLGEHLARVLATRAKAGPRS